MSEIKTHFHISLGIVLPIPVQKINTSKKSSDITQILKEVKPFLKRTASFRKMVSLFVSFIQIAWIKGPLASQIKLCQGASVVAGKKLQEGIRAHIPRLLPPSWAEKRFFYPWEDRQIGHQTPASPTLSPSRAARQRTPVPVWAPGPCRPQAQPPPLLALPFLLSPPATASDWKINGAARTEKGTFLTRAFSLYDR